MSPDAATKGGLEGIIVADVAASEVNGAEGILIYAGYDIEDLAENALFEEVVYLLWHNRLPNTAELEELRAEIARGATVPTSVLNMMKALPKGADPMAVLRTAVSSLAHYDTDSEEATDRLVAYRKAARLTGQITTISAAWNRIRKGQEPIAPRIDLNLSQNFIWMLHGQDPDKTASEAINTYLVLLAEHGMNASTFAARVTTATGSDMHSAVVSAIGTLKGPSHGGANAEAMKMFLEIGSPENVNAWFNRAVKEQGRRVMGIGHRIYKAMDPRATILREHSERLAKSRGNTKWMDLAVRLADRSAEDEYFIERKLYPNVDYYSAILLYTLDLDIDMFTPLFAMSRIAGWSAHIIEQIGGRLIRPESNYVGPRGLKWVPPSER